MTHDPAAREVERIRAVYARRAQTGRERRYSLFEPAHLFQSQTLERALLRALRREGLTTLAGLRILDLGCGEAAWLRSLIRYGADASRLVGVDLREDILPRWNEDLHVAVACGDRLPFKPESFDIVSQLTMMSSVLDAGMRRAIAREMLRVLKPSGIILWYDFTVNPLNHDVAGIRLEQLRELFSGVEIRAQRVTLAPPLTRLLAPRAWLACEALERIPMLRTHLLATLKPSAVN